MADNEETLVEQTGEGETYERATPEPEVEWSAEVLDYVRNRKEELGEAVEEPAAEEEPSQEESQEASPEEEGAQEEASEPEEEAPKESYSKGARRLLAKEAKLRAEREAFAAERAQWDAERAETAAKVETFEQSKADAVLDPVGHLEHCGLDQDALMNAAREIYYKYFPEQANPQVRAEMAAIQAERRMKKLEAAQKAPEKEEPQGPSPEYVAYEAQYKASLAQQAATVDSEQFPLAAEYATNNFNDLVNGMFTAAVQAAQSGQTQGKDLTPVETLAIIEAHLEANKAAFFPNKVANEAQTEEKPAENPKAKAPLRNKTVAARPSDKHSSDLSYDEITEKSRERFYAALREKDMIR